MWAFGARHPLARRAAAGAEPAWKTAEKHFTHLIELITGQTALAQPDATGTVRLAENATVPSPCSRWTRLRTTAARSVSSGDGIRCGSLAYSGGVVTDAERAQHEAALCGLLYLACPDAPAYAITETAAAIAQRSEETPQEPVPEAARLTPRPRPRPRPRPAADDPLYLVGADLSGADLSSLFGVDPTGANLTGAILLAVWGMYRAPSGATWNRETRWPVHLASVVAEQADEVSPGVFQVRDGPAPERSDTVRA
ncbi:hypothetical protein ACFWD7_55640 [Streptomyces mirabilis]|uniref:hypothetical protein n=1 Tax=Streptomyces mirabilis TaxID=68239 RepID=UPI0036B18AD3